MRFLAVEKTRLGVRSGLSGAKRIPLFPCFLTEDWIEKHAELQVALALAVGEQQLEPWMQHREGIVGRCSQVKFRDPTNCGVCTRACARAACTKACARCPEGAQLRKGLCREGRCAQRLLFGAQTERRFVFR